MCAHFVGVQVGVFLTQSGQEGFGVPTQRLFGRDEVGPADVQANPARARLVRRFGRGARVALPREPKHRTSAAAARHPAGAELAAPRRNHESGRRQAHRAPDIAVLLGLLYGASAARLHDMQFSHVFYSSEKHTRLANDTLRGNTFAQPICKQSGEGIFLRRGGWHQGVAARARSPLSLQRRRLRHGYDYQRLYDVSSIAFNRFCSR